MKKIAYLTGTRAEFGLMSSILKAVDKDKNLELMLLVTGMHLMDEFGYTITQVDREFEKTEVVEAVFKKDDRESMARFVGKCTAKTVEVLIKHRPDVVMVLGDRGEQLAMATAAAYLNIPIVHLSGGDLTTTVDDKARRAISMLADWHLPNNKVSKKRLLSMGVKEQKIKKVGASGLDQVKRFNKAKKQDLIVVLQHPDENEEKAAEQMTITLKAVIDFNLPVRIIYPNADAGGRTMIKIIKDFKNKYPKLIKTYKNLEQIKYLKLLSKAQVLVGNSSSGLVEAPSLKLPAVNIGPRQQGRTKAKNVIDVPYNLEAIKKAVKRAMTMDLTNLKNPYEDGQTTEKIIKFLKNLL
ncbi:UDP-N-acetylglucosamine 2-epimerase [Patescibacteria group bacterium]